MRRRRGAPLPPRSPLPPQSVARRRVVLAGVSWALLGCERSAGPEPLGPPPVTVSRQAWGAAPADAAALIAHEPRFITVHHTAVARRPDRLLADKMRSLQRFSQREAPLAGGRRKPAWADVPYHFVIGALGAIAEGRDITTRGASNTDYDLDGHIQVALEGRFDVEDPNPAQLEALERLLRWLQARWSIPAAAIAGHRARGVATSCPGARFEPWIAAYKDRHG